MDRSTKEKLYSATAGLFLAISTALVADYRSKQRTDETVKTSISVIEAQNLFRDKDHERFKKIEEELIPQYSRWVGQKEAKDEEQDRRLNRLDSRVDRLSE